MKRMFVAGVAALGVCLAATETFAGGSVRIVIGPVHRRPIIIAPVPPVVLAPAPVPRMDYGFIDLNVRPVDADVFIDSEYKGPASAYVGKLIQLRVGAHGVMIRREGFRSEQVTIRVEPGRTVELVAELNRVAPPASKVVVVDKADPVAPPVEADAQPPRPTPPSEPTPPAPPTPAAESEEPTASYQVEMGGTGYLALNVVPKDASVYVDDQFYGTASQFNDTDQAIVLRAGAHKVEIARPGFAPYMGTIEVSADKQTNVEVTLKKQEAGIEK